MEHLNKEGLLKILEIKSNLNKGLNLELKEAFPEVQTPEVIREQYTFKGIPDPN
jgi:hypothetical protein